MSTHRRVSSRRPRVRSGARGKAEELVLAGHALQRVRTLADKLARIKLGERRGDQ